MTTRTPARFERAPSPTNNTAFVDGAATTAAPKYQHPKSDISLKNHLSNQRKLCVTIDALRRRYFSEVPTADADGFRRRLAQELPLIVAESGLEFGGYEARCSEPHDLSYRHGNGKYLLHREGGAQAPFCVQYLHFAPHQETLIHDHPVLCTVTPAHGTLRESRYDAVQPRLVRKRSHQDLQVGDVRSIDDVTRSNIHKVKNRTGFPAGSIHLYFMDGEEQHRAVKTVYDKAPKDIVLSPLG